MRRRQRVWHIDWVFWLVVGVVAAPFVAVVVRLWVSGYVSTGDIAAIEIRTRDAFAHFVSLGPYSRFGWNHPGPAMYYVLAPGYWLLGGSSEALLTMVVAINSACAVAIAVLLRQRFGRLAAMCGLAPFAMYVHSLAPDLLTSPWNPDIAMFPFVLLFMLCIEVATGRRGCAPWCVLLASFCVQSHVGYLMPCFAALGVAVVISWRMRAGDSSEGPSVRRPWITAVGVGIVLWLPPLVEQLKHGSEGNLSRIFTYTMNGDSKLGPGAAARLVLAALGTEGSWWRGLAPLNVFSGEDARIDTWTMPWVGLLIVGGLVTASWATARVKREDARLEHLGDGHTEPLSVRHGRGMPDRRTRVSVVITTAVFIACFVSLARVSGFAFPYVYRWLDGVIVCGAILAVCGVVAAWSSAMHDTRGSRFPGTAGLGRRMFVVVCVVALLASSVATLDASSLWKPYEDFPASLIAKLADQILQKFRADPHIEVESAPDLRSSIVTTAMVLEMDKRGVRVSTVPAQESTLGPWRLSRGRVTHIVISTAPLSTRRLALVAHVDELTARDRAAYLQWSQRAVRFFEAGDVAGIKALGKRRLEGTQLYAYVTG